MGSQLGPLGGLLALLRSTGGHVIALACDMPYVSYELLRRLVEAPLAPIVAPRRDGRWEPLFARYDAAQVEPLAHAARGQTALWQLLDAAGAVELPLAVDEHAQLDDWDAPEDVR